MRREGPFSNTAERQGRRVGEHVNISYCMAAAETILSCTPTILMAADAILSRRTYVANVDDDW